MGDRFYGSPALIDWCRSSGWGWRLRCKQDLLVFDKSGGETTLKECFARGEHMLTEVELTEQRARTNVAMLHEAGHPEPWIIALSDPPTTWRAYDYGLRCGIEAMFADYKTRGFNLEDSQIERADRLDRLVLVLSLALYWAVSAGMWDAMENKTPAEKRPAIAPKKRRARPDLILQARPAPNIILPPAHPAPATPIITVAISYGRVLLGLDGLFAIGTRR